MFSSILIAGRGEIATRVAKSCRQLGVHTIAVYGDAKADVVHIEPCDESLKLRPRKDGSLSPKGIVKIAKERKSDVVYPGYARSDNHEELTRILQAQEVAFIGADPDAAKQIADRNTIRTIADNANVRCVERNIDRARAISVLVASDTHGAVAAICEIDQSLAHDGVTIIEETPSPALFFRSDGEAARLALFDSATRLVTESKVVGLVMVDFLIDEKGRAWIRAARPGLPALHAPCEMVTGVDLITLQLRIASGDALAEDFDQLQTTGHAVGVRVRANPSTEFDQPVQELIVPSSPQGRLRIEPTVAAGAPMSIDDRPLITKVSAYAAVRHQAALMVDRSLAAMKVDPYDTNIDKLREILGHHCVRAGQYDVELVNRISTPVAEAV